MRPVLLRRSLAAPALCVPLASSLTLLVSKCNIKTMSEKIMQTRATAHALQKGVCGETWRRNPPARQRGKSQSNAALTTVSLAKHREKKAAASMRCTARRTIATQHRQHPSSRTATYSLLSDTPAPQYMYANKRKELVWLYELVFVASNLFALFAQYRLI